VSRVQTQGGAVEEYRVTVNPDKLRTFALSLDDVSKALSAQNVLRAVGRLEDRYKLYLVISDTRFRDLQQVRQVVLRSGQAGQNGQGALGIVRLADVATVEDATQPQWVAVTADGHDAVLLSIYQQPGSNSVQIAADVKNRLASFRKQLPPGVQIANWYDQSELVTASASSVRDAIVIGVALAALVLWLFLRNLKVTLIAVTVVPAVLATTVVLLHALNMSFNIMTLGGMAAAVGLIIDDAIVMVEHIMRRLAEGGGPKHDRVMKAAVEFLRPLIGSSASTVIIFVPLAFLSGVTGAFFKALSITMASGLLISFLITWLVVPVLADKLLKDKDAQHREPSRLQAWINQRYQALMERLLDRSWLALVAMVPLLVLGWIAYKNVGSGFMPAMDEGGFVLDYRSAPGTALSETGRLLGQVESIVRATPDVATYSRRTGTGLGGSLNEANQGDFFIRLKSGSRRPVDVVMADVRARIEQQVPGMQVEMAQLMEDLIGDLTAVPQPIEVKIYSDNLQQLPVLAERVAHRIAGIQGVVDVKNGINPAGDALQIQVDRVKAAIEGMDPDAITRLVEGYLTGAVTTQISRGEKLVGVRAWVPPVARDSPIALGQLQLAAPDGHLFPLRRVASFSTLTGQPQISRENLKQMVAVTARIEGRDLGSAVQEVKTVIDRDQLLPQGAYYQLGGLYEQQQIAFRGLVMVFAAAAALVFVLLLFLYESFRLAICILVTALLAVSAVFTGLWLTHTELNITAMMGMTMIVGIVTEVAIVYFSEQEELAAGRTATRRSLVTAGINRMRPIAMTTIAALLTLLPLALAIGQGSQMQQPLAIAIISGLVVQLPLVLIIMPALFYLLHPGGSASSGASQIPRP
jgi:CzcA family heavy metal efflux pump